MAYSPASTIPTEAERRRPNAKGRPIRLADGEAWLLAIPSYRADRWPLTLPDVDDVLGRLYDSMTLDGAVQLADLFEAAAALLRVNYVLTDEELTELLGLDEGEDCRRFAETIVGALFPDSDAPRTYADWIRHSLLGGGLGDLEVPGESLSPTLFMLVSTGKAPPPTSFVASNLQAQEQASLDQLL